MIDRDLASQAGRGIKNLNFIWYTMLGFLAVYFLAGMFLKGSLRHSPRDPAFLSTLRWTLYFVSAGTFFLACLFKRMLMGSKRVLKGWTQVTERQQHPAVARYTTAVVISLALAESIGIYGLILYFFKGDVADLVSLIVLSAVAMILCRPRREELLGLMKRETLAE